MANATNINILNAIRKVSDLGYSNRIPAATKDNIDDIYNSLLDIVPLRNAFVESLVSQIMMQRIETGFFDNPLALLKKEPMRYGMTEEEIFINFAKGKAFNQFATVSDLYKFYKAEIMAAYHKLTPPMQYAVTISYDNIRNAFRDEYGIRDLINAKVQSLFNGANWDEYLIMKELVESAYKKGQLYPVHVDDVLDSEQNAKNMTKLIKGYIGQMAFPHPEYNIAGAESTCPADNLYILITPEVDAALDVDVLAYAYNNDFAKLKAHKIIVDKFNNPALQAVLFDMRFFNVRENFKTLSDSKNGAALSWNYFYTVSEMFSYSPFFNCIAFTKDAVDLSPVISVENATTTRNSTVTLKIDVSGSDYVAANYDVEISGQKSPRTNVIPGSNIVSIAEDETATEINVKVKSRIFDSAGDATITVL